MNFKKILTLTIVILSILITYNIKLWYIDNNFGYNYLDNYEINNKVNNSVKEDNVIKETQKNETKILKEYEEIPLTNSKENKQNITKINNTRLNILILGVEKDPRSDVIIFTSIDLTKNKVDIISIPRDTYYYISTHPSGDHRKINAAYAREREKGSIKAIEDILNIKIDNYITIRYEGVEKIVDLIGGVEVNVPSWIKDLPSGKQVLNGDQSVKFLRARKGYIDGDLGRIKAQQEFIKSFFLKLKTDKKLLLKLPNIIKNSIKYIDTDLKLSKIISLSYKLKDFKEENINIYILPGKAEVKRIGNKNWWYYFYDKEKIEKLLKNIK